MSLSIRTSNFPISALRLLVCLVALLQISAAKSSLGTVNLEWDRNPEDNIAGYIVHYGTTRGDYSKFHEVRDLTTATLADLEPGTTYYCAVQAFTTTGFGGFLSLEISFDVPQSIPPDFSVAQAWGSELNDLTAASQGIDFGSIYIETPGFTQTFILKNPGSETLTGLAITGNDENFSVTRLGTTTLEPGEITVFNVTFRPSTTGSYATVLQVVSGETGDSVLDIDLRGAGVAEPGSAIDQPVSFELAASTSDIRFNDTLLGTTSTTETVTLTNTGSAVLTHLSITTDSPEFFSIPLGSTTLAPGESSTFQVSFRPSAAGTRGGQLSIVSHEGEMSPKLINLTGTGIAAPEIEVSQSGGKDLTDEEAAINLGTAELGAPSTAQIVTIHNSGTARLENLAIVKSGIHAADFTISRMRTTSLAPGASIAFWIGFSPSKTGMHWAVISIASNDGNEASFDIVVTGSGIAPSPAAMATMQPLAAPARLGSISGITTAPVRGIEVIGGRKYLTLTLTKTPEKTALPRSVEVTSNLVVWSSGKAHTTVLIDSATTLKVRDNTPLTRNAKRYIRLKPKTR